MIRLIATDLDDTLLNAQSGLSPRTKQALKRAIEIGCGICLSSGRMLEAMRPLAGEIGVNAPMLLYNGAMIYDINTDKTIYAPRISHETALGIVKLAEAHGWYVQCYPGKNYYCPKVLERTLKYAKQIGVEPTPVNKPLSEWLETDCQSDMQKLLIIGDDAADADRALETMREAFPGGANFLKSRANFVEIAPEGVNKGQSLVRLAEYLGLQITEVMAFGDGQNDTPMIAAAGTGVAMANACPQAKAAADRIAPSNLEDGVAQIIEEYIEKGWLGGLA